MTDTNSNSNTRMHNIPMNRIYGNLLGNGTLVDSDAKAPDERALDSIQDRVEYLSESVRIVHAEPLQAPDSLVQRIRSRPIRSVLMAAGLGFLFGILRSRR